MKIHISNIQGLQVGGGFTFLRNFLKSMSALGVEFLENWQDADIVFVPGVTMANLSEIDEAKRAGKKIVFRVDNVPRKSRNRRSTPHERMRDLARQADLVIYQSLWAKAYCYPLSGDGKIVYNGVDQSIFYPPETPPEKIIFLFAYHGKNELKCFWQAHYYYQMYHRMLNGNCEFWFIYDFGHDLEELQRSNFDFWNGEKFTQFAKIDDPHRMAELMRQCTFLIYPAIADASPNIVLEALACGLRVNDWSPDSGVSELIQLSSRRNQIGINRMALEYFEHFINLLK